MAYYTTEIALGLTITFLLMFGFFSKQHNAPVWNNRIPLQIITISTVVLTFSFIGFLTTQILMLVTR